MCLRRMAMGAEKVTNAFEHVVAVSQQTSSSAQQVVAAAEEQAAKVEEVAGSSEKLAGMAMDLEIAVSRFIINHKDLEDEA